MSPAMAVTMQTRDDDVSESQYQKGVKHLYENGLKLVPKKYILPTAERPVARGHQIHHDAVDAKQNLSLPVIDFSELQGPNRNEVLRTLADACERYGFFQLVNHGISDEVIRGMLDVSTKFFELPFEERAKYMSADMRAPVRYGTSFNQAKDEVFTWRDFLKLLCHPMSDFLPHWPSSPVDFREVAATYAKETKLLYVSVMEAILESLGVLETAQHKKTEEDDNILKDLEDGSQLMVVNYYPPCPEPDLTLGIPPHSDYGFLTLLLQDEVEGLQVQFQEKWITVEPIPHAFVVNVGDHLEICSNGRYKSVLHRVLVNSLKRRVSVASFHSLAFSKMVSPSPKLIDQHNPRRYKDTDFNSFLEFVASRDTQKKDFLESRKLTHQ